MRPELRPLVETLWSYHQLGHEPAPADAIVVLCSHDTRVAERGVELFHAGLAPMLVFSGGLGSITRGLWTEPEAEKFAAIAVSLGVPRDRILAETASSNTGENVLFTRRLLEARGVAVRRVLLVQKPYMERRAYATFRKVWPEPEVLVTSPRVSMDEYLARYANDALSEDDVIDILVGDLQRIRVYAERGFQIPQPVPEHVWSAYEALVRAGYSRRLV